MSEGHRNPFAGVTEFFSEINRMRELGRHGYEHGPEDRERTHATASSRRRTSSPAVRTS